MGTKWKVWATDNATGKVWSTEHEGGDRESVTNAFRGTMPSGLTLLNVTPVERKPSSTIVETFITFGFEHGVYGAHHNGYVTIEAPTRSLGRSIAFAIFGDEWAFDYDKAPELRYAPHGELLRISWVPMS